MTNSSKKIEWQQGDPSPNDPRPDAFGWYPLLHEWEAPEGFYPRAGFWNGETWLDAPGGHFIPGAIMFLPQVFSSAMEAELCAKENEIDV